jgi:hypothetical protein
MESVRSLLADRGAAGIEHPGGTLLAHLDRVGAKLTEWGVRPALAQAGLCHAFYGTDGFRLALADLSERALLASAVGAEAEELVYFYCACDRSFSYPGVSSGGLYRDRFTREVFVPSPEMLSDFVELTVANELDLVEISAEFREAYGPGFRTLFGGWSSVMSAQAWAEYLRVFG